MLGNAKKLEQWI